MPVFFIAIPKFLIKRREPKDIKSFLLHGAKFAVFSKMQGNKKKKEGWAVFILFFPLHFGPMISPDLRATIHNRKNRERAKHQHATILVFVLTMCQSFGLLRFVWQLSSYVSDRIINRSRPLTAASDPLTFFKYHNRCTSFFSRHLPNDSSCLFSANGSCNNVPLLSSSL